MKHKTLVIIPARGGSKRLPRKNILSFNGKPLIQWTIELAIKAKFEHIVVTSDDDEVLSISSKFSEIISLKRPLELATDTASTNDVISHVLDQIKITDIDNIMLLQPTSPLRTLKNLNEAIQLFHEGGYASVVSVNLVDHPKDYIFQLEDNNSLDDFYIRLKSLPIRSQDFNREYCLNGAIYITRINDFKKNKTLFNSPGRAYIMSRENSIDIDEPIDFNVAEALIKAGSVKLDE